MPCRQTNRSMFGVSPLPSHTRAHTHTVTFPSAHTHTQVENVVGNMSIPVGVATNMIVDGVERTFLVGSWQLAVAGSD